MADNWRDARPVEIGAGPVIGDAPPLSSLHVSAVGADFPGKIEPPLSLLRDALVVPDIRAALGLLRFPQRLVATLRR